MLKTISSIATQIISSITGGLVQFTGPTAGTTRVITVPNANATMARTDAGQTFVGTQIMTTLRSSVVQGPAYPQTSTVTTTSIIDTGIFKDTASTGFGNAAIYDLYVSANTDQTANADYRSWACGFVAVATGTFTAVKAQNVSYTSLGTGNLGTTNLTVAVTFFDASEGTIKAYADNYQIRLKISGFSNNTGSSLNCLLVRRLG